MDISFLSISCPAEILTISRYGSACFKKVKTSSSSIPPSIHSLARDSQIHWIIRAYGFAYGFLPQYLREISFDFLQAAAQIHPDDDSMPAREIVLEASHGQMKHHHIKPSALASAQFSQMPRRFDPFPFSSSLSHGCHRHCCHRSNPIKCRRMLSAADAAHVHDLQGHC